MTHRASTGGRLFWLGLGLSLAVHLTLGFHLFTRREHMRGAVDVPTDAISVNLETTDVLNAREESAAVEAAGGNPPAETGKIVPPDEAKPEPEEARQPPAPDEPVKAENPPERPIEPDRQAAEREAQQRIAEDALRRAEAEREKRDAEESERQAQQRAEEEKREQRAAEERERRAEAREEAEKQRREKRKAVKAPAGATGSQGARASSGRVAASQGAVRDYAAVVRARIFNRTASVNFSSAGIVTIAFSIAPSGQLSYARVKQSSGTASVDQAGLESVRGASPFPPPPDGKPYTNAIPIRSTLRSR